MSTQDPRRWWALIALVPAVLVVGIDATVLGLALPTLATSLRASTAELQWFVAAYALVFAAAMVPAGMLGDRYGRKKLLIIALVVLGAGSVACGYATSAGLFIAARALLGLGAAIIVPMALGAIPVLFSEEERPKAVATIMAATMIGQPIGPLLGGWLLTSYWWGSVFLINVPVVVVALVAVALLVPESQSTERTRFDLIGIAASSAGLATLMYGVIEAGQNGWGSPGAVGAMLAGAAVLAGFALWERRVRDPLVDLRLFRSPGFTWGIVLATLVSFAMFGVLFATPLYFQDVLGLSAFGNGLRQLPLIGGLLIGAIVGTRMTTRTGAKATVALGFVLLAAGLFLGATTGLGNGGGFAMAWLAIAGAGIGFVMPAAMNAALGALSPEHAGVGSGLIQALRMVGGSFGAAILGSVLNSTYQGRLSLGGLPAQVAAIVRDSVAAGVAVAHQLGSAALLESVRSAFVHGMDVALLVCGGVAVVGVALTLAFLPDRERDRAAAAARSDVAAAAPSVAAAAAAPRPSDEGVESGHGPVFGK